MSLFEELLEAVLVPGVTGYEEKVREWIISKVEGLGRLSVDALGNVYLDIGEPKRAFVAHMDEVGFVVTRIEENGYLRVRPMGGVPDELFLARPVELFGEEGVVHGVMGFVPPHIRRLIQREEKPPKWYEAWVDVGASSREEVEDMGVAPLTPGRFVKTPLRNGDTVMVGGLDDRAGTLALVRLARALSDDPPKEGARIIWSVQEEFGLRGAKAIPIEGIREVYVVDTMTSAELPGVPAHLAPIAPGRGPALRAVDARFIASRRLLKKAMSLAPRYQLAAGGGTTDGMAIQEKGVDVLPVCIPVKYTHSPAELMHLGDLQETIELLEALARS
ncbi:MAG: M42 family peptidase [Thermoplasmata archaeon]|nr:MAG: M42 family peptidase [Thermoplasmata archaeon]HDJ27535.1 M28 family peptidase [Aciduliprofundum sp.]